jgi:hypothetical protein
MESLIVSLATYLGVPAILGIGGWAMKTVSSRLSALEDEMVERTTDKQVRQIVSDKIDPLREDIHELKAKLDKIVDLLLSK